MHTTNTIINDTNQCITHITTFQNNCSQYLSQMQDELLTHTNQIDFQVSTINNLNKTISNLKKQTMATQIELKHISTTHDTYILQSTIDFKQYYQTLLDKHMEKINTIQQQCSIDDVLTLNVGGILYTTRKSTLQSIDNTFIDILVSGRFKPTLDAQQNIFIDRDGTLFKHILNFLRDPVYISTIKLLPQCEIQALVVEANYYGIHPIILLDKCQITSVSNTPALNSHIKIFWTKDNQWYPGIVTKIDKHSTYIKYDDGDTRTHNSHILKWIYI